jgi:hypothetical protein
MYVIHIGNNGYETSEQIRARLDPANSTEARYIAAIDRIERQGIRYSNEDFAVLSGARAAIWRHRQCEHFEVNPECTPTEFWRAVGRWPHDCNREE